MFSARAVNRKINRLHERGLRTLLNDETSTFDDMLSKSNDTTIPVKNIQKLMIEFYKYLYGLSAPITKEVFTKRFLEYHFKVVKQLFCQILKPPKNDTDTIAYKATQLWSTLQTRLKYCSDCPCNISPIFLDGVGFIK